jgi:hypothetical protein
MSVGWRVGLGIAGLAAALYAAGCKDSTPTGPDESPSTIVFPTTEVSYAAHVQPLFNQTCALSGCHDDGPRPNPLSLTSYENLMFNSLQVVVRGEPDQSVLILRIEGRIAPRMPLSRNPLNQNQISGLRTWIAEGALNN